MSFVHNKPDNSELVGRKQFIHLYKTRKNLMKTLAQRITLFLAGTALITSCSRPYATVQRTPAQKFATTTQTAPVQTIATAQADAPVVVETPVVAPAVETAAVQTQLNEAVASNKTVMADKRVQKQMAKINAVLATSAQKSTMTPTATAKKMNMVERMMVKKIDKKIKNKMSPEKTMAKSLLTLGAIIAVAGLILLLVGGAGLGTLGGIALIVGLVLILIDLLR